MLPPRIEREPVVVIIFIACGTRSADLDVVDGMDFPVRSAPWIAIALGNIAGTGFV